MRHNIIGFSLLILIVIQNMLVLLVYSRVNFCGLFLFFLYWNKYHVRHSQCEIS